MLYFAIPKSQSGASRKRLFALRTVAVSETTARLLCEPRTPKAGAFIYPKSQSYENFNQERKGRLLPLRYGVERLWA